MRCQSFPGRGWAPEHQLPPSSLGRLAVGHVEKQSSPLLTAKKLLWTMHVSLPKRFLGDVGMPGWKWTFRQLKWKRLLDYPHHSVFPNSLLPLWALQLLDDSHCWEAELQTSLSLCPTASDTFRGFAAPCRSRLFPLGTYGPLHDAEGSDGDRGGQ